MAGIGCLLKDTSIIESVKDLMKDLAVDFIERDQQFTIKDAYNILRDNDIEIDIETVGQIYEDTFDLTDGNFSTQSQVDMATGAIYRTILDKISNVRPFTGEQEIGMRSPGKAAADSIALMFKSGMTIDNRTQSVMKMFEDKMRKAASAYLDKSIYPPIKGPDTRSFTEILEEALDLDNQGYRTTRGTLNSAIDVFEEFQNEVNKYLADLASGVAKGDIDPMTLAQYEVFTKAIMDKSYDLLLSQKEMTTIIKDALKKGGFTKTVIKNGVTSFIFDWEKLTDAANDVDFLKENVTNVLQGEGFTPREIDVINSAMEREYIRLREDIILKRLNVLAERNKINLKPEKSTDTRKLAKLYAMGWFEDNPDAYENIVNKVLNISDVDVDTFNKLNVLGRALSSLYKHNYESDEYLKSALNSINEQIGNLLNEHSNSKSKIFRVAGWIDVWLGMSLRALLTSISNSVLANQISAMEAQFRNNIAASFRGENSAEKSNFISSLKWNVFRDITLNGGMQYGDLSSTYMTRNQFDSYVNKKFDSKVAHAVISALTGRMLLDGTDSLHKSQLVHTYFIHNLSKILVNKMGYSKADAISEINKKLYGKSYEDMVVEAQKAISDINTEAGQIVLKDNKESVERLAADMVMSNLVGIDKRMNYRIVTSAYKAAYQAGGYEIGHVPNNFFSAFVAKNNGHFQEKMKKALKEKDYSRAARYKFMGTIYNSFINPFANGGTNWLVIQAERIGFGILRSKSDKVTDFFTGYKNLKSFSEIDITSNEGLNDIQEALFNENKKDVQLKRGVAGVITNMIMLGIAYTVLSSLKGDDEEEFEFMDNFFKANKWLKKYIVSLPLEWTFLTGAFTTGNTDYFKQILGIAHDNYNFKSKFLKSLDLYSKGETAEGDGMMGEAFGTLPVNPVTSARMYYQGKELYKGFGSLINGTPLTKQEFTKSRSFFQGLFSYGMVKNMELFEGSEWYDFRNPEYDLTSLPGAGSATLKNMKELGLNSISDLKKYVGEKYPSMPFSQGLRNIKVKDSAGRMQPLFDRKDASIIEEIVDNGNRLPSMLIDDAIPDGELQKKFAKNRIYTMTDLLNARNTGTLNAINIANNVSDKDKQLMDQKIDEFEKEFFKK